MLSSLLTALVALAGPVVVLVLVITRAHGRARSLGITGAVLLLVSGLVQVTVSRLLPFITQQLNLPISTYGLLLVPGSLLSVAGVILLGAAIAAAFPRRGPSQGYPGGPGGPAGFTR
ncbi:hypothetical protein FHX74_001539 [Friedmanniella endophytica]|uniref:Uncharacterized protein n=1 Tax=Microlunatus kandeliicorticis TaxID=1759536 RepID=A0A7W3P5F5_9ACTN|nr:hypothetical protein [Microlunatus kandeliicorticis]MBA8793934.1 hypothetical protein [Microlunatus kandeliicorticis]